jgi:cytochrome c6
MNLYLQIIKMSILKGIFYFFLILFITLLSFEKVIAIENGEKLFSQNCSACHLDGTNIIIPEKNLLKETLKENGMASVSAISYQILNGKNGMPAFGGRLKEEEIESIAIYVLGATWKNF